MKNILVFIFFISAFANAQFIVKGTMTPTIKSDWVILYKIEGARQVYIKDTKIKLDSLTINNKKQVVGNFSFTLPKDAKPGAYRATYKLEGAGFVDFIFNKENISFVFHPDYPNQSISFSESKENIIYKQYLDEISKKQQQLDSIQITALRNSDLDLKSAYKTTLNTVISIQKKYLESTKNMYVFPFIKATLRANPKEIKTSPKGYMTNMVATFFDNMDFSDTTLMNSAFLVDRITDYVFYINYSDNKEKQNDLFKSSVKTILSKIKVSPFKKDIIEFLVAQFQNTKNLELIDFLINENYKKLPEGLQSKNFIKEKEVLFATEIGRTAPDFTWNNNGKNLKLSTLNEAENYVLLFWSTDCSHCLREIPELHKSLQGNKKVKVIAFSLERNDFGWKNMKKTLSNWHHVLGLNKWENKIARTYNIMSTPTYFVLDKSKKIIAKPEELKDLQAFINKL